MKVELGLDRPGDGVETRFEAVQVGYREDVVGEGKAKEVIGLLEAFDPAAGQHFVADQAVEGWDGP